ncbi:hypothetical protein PC9H_003090 [Pleurotus ostreatus]|uniref:Uncharacterized protein n=1 Tax=Pleurotus ostreatus TaxID=5322 RepID=A0A8H7A1V7_PLEOS|nr:uncharacterized protein PC9H_003090 [Pleurotus ostreatus]KAF7436261.1 hypothetical protein PC9H_003090 [Pleurotus ostreatus]
MSPSGNPYQVVPSSPEPAENALNVVSEKSSSNSAFLSSRNLVLISSVATVVTSLLSLYTFISAQLTPYHSIAHASTGAPLLRRPGTYMNLDKLPVNDSQPHFHPIHSFAHILLQIDTSDPQRKLHENYRKYDSPQGEIYPDDRYFLVSSSTSTIIQFRNLDFRMEKCVLDPTIPSHNVTSPDSGFEPSVRVDASSIVDVWMLDNTQELSRHTQWTYAPRRKTCFRSISLRGEGSRRIEFFCPVLAKKIKSSKRNLHGSIRFEGVDRRGTSSREGLIVRIACA